jgi:tripartite-type tricarboxylate transporter receptor subunit TctC
MRTILAAVILYTAWAAPVSADAISDFYKDKSLTMVIGSDAGGGYDLAGRLVAQYLGKHIPGQPTFVPRNMPGASSVRAAEWFGSAAPGGGTTVSLLQATIVTNKLVDRKAAYDPARFIWLGRLSTAPLFGLVRSDAPIKTVEEARTKDVILAANSATGTAATVPWALNRLAGTKFKVVRGYASAAAVGLAIDRGEAEGIGSASLEYIESKPEWLGDKKMRLIYFIGLTRYPQTPDVPAIVELGKNDEDKAVLKLLGVAATIGRSFAVTPNTPPNRAEALRKAFADMMRDPEFIAAAEKRKVDLDYASGDEIQKDVADIVAIPDAVVTRYNAVTQPMD